MIQCPDQVFMSHGFGDTKGSFRARVSAQIRAASLLCCTVPDLAESVQPLAQRSHGYCGGQSTSTFASTLKTGSLPSSSSFPLLSFGRACTAQISCSHTALISLTMAFRSAAIGTTQRFRISASTSGAATWISAGAACVSVHFSKARRVCMLKLVLACIQM